MLLRLRTIQAIVVKKTNQQPPHPHPTPSKPSCYTVQIKEQNVSNEQNISFLEFSIFLILLPLDVTASPLKYHFYSSFSLIVNKGLQHLYPKHQIQTIFLL